MIGLVGYTVLKKIPPDLFNILAKHFELSSTVGLMFFIMSLSGILGLIMLIYEGRFWNTISIIVHTTAIILTIKISLDLFNIPKAPLLFAALITFESVELFSCAYLTITKQMLKS